MLKRLFDIFSSACGLIILSPILLICMIILKFSGEGEIFFLQKRLGYKNVPFHITKFATMLKSAAFMKDGDYTVQNDPRVLPVGKFLRKSKINELMQLWDVFRGKMSLVGPRPQTLNVSKMYPPEFDMVLNTVRPGVTGIGSIVFRDEERILTEAVDRDLCYKTEIVPYKAELEIWYAENASLWLDIKLIFVTAWAIINPNSQGVMPLLPEHLRRDVTTFKGEAKKV